MTDKLIEQLKEGVVLRPKRWSGDTHYDLGGSADEEATDLLMEKAAHRIEELEDERDEAFNQLDSTRHSVEVLEANVARLQWALQELDSDPAITVAEHVQEYDRLAPFLPRSAEAVSLSRAALQDKGTD